jgi:hypothetical protein
MMKSRPFFTILQLAATSESAMGDEVDGDDMMEGDAGADRAAAALEGLSLQEEKVIEVRRLGQGVRSA